MSGEDDRPAGFDRGIAAIWLGLGAVFIALYSLLTPPFQAPDEQQHYFRTYQVSVGHLLPEHTDTGLAVTLPQSMDALVVRFLGSSAIRPDRAVRPHPLTDTFATLRTPLNPDLLTRAPIAVAYPPSAYLPQTVGMMIGRATGLGPLGLLYACRLANGLFSLVIVWIALRMSPGAGTSILALAMLPMSLSLFASCSPDGSVISTAMLFAAVARRLVSGERSPRLQAISLACLAVFAAAKYVYLPLGLAGAAVVLNRQAGRTVQRTVTAAIQVASVILIGLGTVAWLAIAGSVSAEPGADIVGQLASMRAAPWRFLMAIGKTIAEDAGIYLHQTIGVLGLLSVALPRWIYALAPFGVALSLLTAGSPARIPSRAAGAWLGLIVLSVSLVFAGLYLQWNPVGAARVDGVQGRYFLPILPFVAPLVQVKGPPLFSLCAIGISVLVASAGIPALVLAYNLFG